MGNEHTAEKLSGEFYAITADLTKISAALLEFDNKTDPAVENPADRQNDAAKESWADVLRQDTCRVCDAVMAAAKAAAEFLRALQFKKTAGPQNPSEIRGLSAAVRNAHKNIQSLCAAMQRASERIKSSSMKTNTCAIDAYTADMLKSAGRLEYLSREFAKIAENL